MWVLDLIWWLAGLQLLVLLGQGFLVVTKGRGIPAKDLERLLTGAKDWRAAAREARRGADPDRPVKLSRRAVLRQALKRSR